MSAGNDFPKLGPRGDGGPLGRGGTPAVIDLTLVALHPDHADGFGGLGPAAALATGVAVYGGLAPAGPSRADYRNETPNLRLTPEIPKSVG